MKKYTWEQKGKAIDQGVLQVDCSEDEDSNQGILDWLCVLPDVGVNMVALEYLIEGDTDAISNVSDSSEEELTLEAKEFSMIQLSDHTTL